MKHILVPCDFSTPSKEAFTLAIQIASQTKAEVTVLHVIYIPVMYDPNYMAGAPFAQDAALITALEEDAKVAFEKLKAKQEVRDVNVKLEVIHGEILSTIKRVTEKNKIDLIIMGTSGATGLQELFIGSTTEKVVRHSSVPVLAVRKAPDPGSIKNILLPTTLLLDQVHFINEVKALQNFFGASLHVLLINTPGHFRQDTEGKAALEEFAKHYKLNDYKLHFTNYNNEEYGIIDFARNEGIDLIAMGTHARKGLAHLFNHSVTEGVVNHIQIPIWTYCLRK